MVKQLIEPRFMSCEIKSIEPLFLLYDIFESCSETIDITLLYEYICPRYFESYYNDNCSDKC